MKKLFKKGLVALTLMLGMTFTTPQNASAASTNALTTSVNVNQNLSQTNANGVKMEVVYSDDRVTVIVIKFGDQGTIVVTIDNRGETTRQSFGEKGGYTY